MLGRSGGGRGLPICLCFFLYPSKMISKEDCFPLQPVCGNRWVKEKRQWEGDSGKYKPERLLQVLAAFIL